MQPPMPKWTARAVSPCRTDTGYARAMARRSDPSSGTAASPGALRSLVGAGPSQVGIVGALRARDVSRPAERHVRDALAKPAPVARPTPRQDVSDVPRPNASDDGRQDASDAGTEGATPVSS